MPRKARKDIIGHQEDFEREEREEGYVELRCSLRSEWRGSDDHAVSADEFEALQPLPKAPTIDA